MPLKKACDLKAYNDNVAELVRSGRDQKQAVAIAIRTLKKSCGVTSDMRMTPKEIVGKHEEAELIRKLSEDEKTFQKHGYTTGEKLRELASGLDLFKDLDDKQWLRLGKRLKNLRATPAVFSGAMRAIFKLWERGHDFPATEQFLAKYEFKTSRYAFYPLMSILLKYNILKKVQMPGRNIMSVAEYAPDEKKIFANSPKEKFEVYVYNPEFIKVMNSWLKKNAVRHRLEQTELEKALLLNERLDRLANEIGWAGRPMSDCRFSTLDEVLDEIENEGEVLRPGPSDMKVIGEFRRQSNLDYKGLNRITDPRMYWAEFVKQCNGVKECLRIYGLALDHGLPGLEDSFQQRAVELANQGRW